MERTRDALGGWGSRSGEGGPFQSGCSEIRSPGEARGEGSNLSLDGSARLDLKREATDRWQLESCVEQNTCPWAGKSLVGGSWGTSKGP